VAFTVPHFPLHAPAEDIARYRERYEAGWDVIRQRRWERLRELGIVSCALPPPEPEVTPRWNLSEAELRDRIGPQEVARAVPWERLTADQRAFQAEKMAIHAAMIDRMDRAIGRVLDQVRAMGALDDTLVLFASDNGASAEQIIRGDGHDPAGRPGSAGSFLCLGPGWSTAANTPFRLHKSWVHEGGIATPLIVSWPEGIAARGELRSAPVHLIDLVPTLLDLMGAHRAASGDGAGPPLPGLSLVPAFAGDAPLERDFLYFNHDGHSALRVGRWKWVTRAETGHTPELYDLADDRCELKNLAARRPDLVRELTARWQELEDQFRRQAGPEPDRKDPQNRSRSHP
jgi:arylsulfatase A-like enzyme